MIIVPLVNDEIVTKDGATLIVLGFTNYKSKGPAVFANGGGTTPIVPVYFFDIDKINGTRVEYSTSSKVFSALGKVKRKIHLPQVNDVIFVHNFEDENGDLSDEDQRSIEVKALKLHSKKYGLAKGLLFIGDDDKPYRIQDVLDIKREYGSSEFNARVFHRIYKEYKGS